MWATVNVLWAAKECGNRRLWRLYIGDLRGDDPVFPKHDDGADAASTRSPKLRAIHGKVFDLYGIRTVFYAISTPLPRQTRTGVRGGIRSSYPLSPETADHLRRRGTDFIFVADGAGERPAMEGNATGST